MKSILFLMLTMAFFTYTPLQAQKIKNAKTETFTVYGNCGMCKTTIEKAGNEKKVSEVNWDKDTHIATVTYNPEKTTSDAILKRIADAGYDNEKFTAPDQAYNGLHGCCQYDRPGSDMKHELPSSPMK